MRHTGDLELNAYIDNELSGAERMELLAAMQSDPGLARDACALSNLQDRIRIAYANPPRLAHWVRREKRSRRASRAAGLLLLGVGLLGGWLMGSHHDSTESAERFVVLDPEGRGQSPATPDSNETRIVFHLTDLDQTAAGELLVEVEQMLRLYQDEKRPLRVEIVAHGEGLDLLRVRLTQHQDQIRRLAKGFANLTFVACRNTIERVQVSQGTEVHILPSAKVTDSGVDHVVKRQRQGWLYIRV